MIASEKPVLVPLTHEHLVEWHGAAGARPTVKGTAAYLGGKLVAIAGLIYYPGVPVAFCELREEARDYKLLLAWGGAKLIREAKTHHKHIVAIIDHSEPSAERWLTRLGFRHENGDKWVWRTSA